MFEHDRYSVRWQFLSFRNKYRIYEDGDLVLRLRYDQGGLPGGVHLVDADGATVFRIRTDRVIAGPAFTVLDEPSGTTIGRIEREMAGRRRQWRFTDADGAVVAHVRRRTVLPGLVRRLFSGFALFVPPSYAIDGPDGTRLGTIDGRFKLRDAAIAAEKRRRVTLPGMDAGYTYTVDLREDTEDAVDPRLAVCGAIAIDVVDAAGSVR